MMRARATMAAALLVLGMGCGDDSSRTTGGRGVGARQPVVVAPPAAPAKPPRRHDPRLARTKLVPRGDEGPLLVEVPADPAAPAAPAERDLAAELRALTAGGAPRCLNQVPGLPSALSLQVTAAVTTSGLITRAEVAGPGLPAAAAECLRQHLVSARMRAPVEGAPRSITATVPLSRPTP